MASDFGDESGQRLLDDFVRYGQQAGIEKMRERAYAVRRACDHARAGALAQVGAGAVDDPKEWAKLDMHEFQGIEGYERIKGVIESKLSAYGAEFHWHADAKSGKEYLLFKIKDAREVWACFGELSQEARTACEKAAEKVAELEKGGAERADVWRGGPGLEHRADAGGRAAGQSDVKRERSSLFAQRGGGAGGREGSLRRDRSAEGREDASGGGARGDGGKAALGAGAGDRAQPDAVRAGGRGDARQGDYFQASRGARVGWASEVRANGESVETGRDAGGEAARVRARKGSEHAGGSRRKRGAPARPDARPLEERAEHARAASAALEGEGATTRAKSRGPRMQEVRSK